MRIVLGFLGFSALALCGCSSAHPLPSDVVRLEVHQIVHHIRCEARAVVVALFNGEHAAEGLYPKVLSRNYEEYKAREKDIEAADAYHKDLVKDANALNKKAADIKERRELSGLKVEKAHLDLIDVNQGFKWDTGNIKDNILKALAQRGKALKELDRRRRVEANRFEKEELYQKIDSRTFNTKSKRQGAELAAERKALREGQFKELDTFLRYRLAYRLELKATRNVTLGSTFSVKIPIPLGQFSIDKLDPNLDDERYSARTVLIVASFEELVDMTTCGGDGHGDRLRSLTHPIVGEVGLKEVALQYMKIMNHPDKLNLKTQKNEDGETYYDVLRFKTIIGGGANPKISITNSAGQNFSGQFSPTLKRTDEHQLTVYLAWAKPPEIEDGDEDGAPASTSASGTPSRRAGSQGGGD